MRIDRGGDGKPLTMREDDGTVVPLVSGFLQSLTARGDSPNTVMVYGDDLRRLSLFVRASQRDVEHFTARYSLDCLAYLKGGRRSGEVLNLHREDVQYGRCRVVIRHRTDRPQGVPTKARIEPVVELDEPDTLAAGNA
jgi:hypothetical protein